MPSSAGGTGSSVPGWGTKIPRASYKNQNIKQKQYCNKLNKDFKNGPHQKKKKTKKKKPFRKRRDRKERSSVYLPTEAGGPTDLTLTR